MGSKTAFPSLCARVLLIAFAIQGITPDPHDLASLSLIRLLGPEFAVPGELVISLEIEGDHLPAEHSWPSSEGRAPLHDDDQDELPDEVCVPTREKCLMMECRARENSHSVHFLAAFNTASVARQSRAHVRSISRFPLPLGDPFHALCRLTC
jgi:hypothetical protein